MLLQRFGNTENMDILIEKYCKDTWRSLKVFRHSGTVKQFSKQFFQEIRFESERLLTINLYQEHKYKTLIQTNKWNIGFVNRKHFLNIEEKPAYEIITLNHADLVLGNPVTHEKIFFARLPAWENFMNQGITYAL